MQEYNYSWNQTGYRKKKKPNPPITLLQAATLPACLKINKKFCVFFSIIYLCIVKSWIICFFLSKIRKQKRRGVPPPKETATTRSSLDHNQNMGFCLFVLFRFAVSAFPLAYCYYLDYDTIYRYKAQKKRKEKKIRNNFSWNKHAEDMNSMYMLMTVCVGAPVYATHTVRGTDSSYLCTASACHVVLMDA